MKRVTEQCVSGAKKKNVILQNFRPNYSKEWPCLSSSNVSERHTFFNVCTCDFSIAHGGRDDCRRHIESKKHAEHFKAVTSNKSISSFFATSEETKVTNAELLFTSFLVEHNLPIAVADHSSNLYRAMFPDSKISQKYSCARTKTSALVEYMAGETKSEIVESLVSGPFALATDGSTDCNAVKIYPLVVSFLNQTQGKICTVQLSLVESTDNTGYGIFSVLNKEFERFGISWKNCVAFACDNANTMIGTNKGVVAFVKEKHPSIVVQGCSCHLIHLAAKKASAQLTISIETFLVNIFYYLEKRSKRQNHLKVYQEVCGAKSHKILKYVSTRWLSLLDSVDRVLEQWEALKLLFCSDPEKKEPSTSQYENVKSLMQDPLTVIFLAVHFLFSTK